MKLEQSFEVSAPLEQVWKALIDVEQVAPCLPGAAITGRNDDGSYAGSFTIKIGPTTASYAGRLEMKGIDESGHTATMQAQGTDKRGQGGATATIVSKLTPAGDGATQVSVDTDYHITGRLARFGRGGMIEDISERLLREFATRLQASLASGGGADRAAPTQLHDTAQAPSPPAGEPVTAAARTRLHRTEPLPVPEAEHEPTPTEAPDAPPTPAEADAPVASEPKPARPPESAAPPEPPAAPKPPEPPAPAAEEPPARPAPPPPPPSPPPPPPRPSQVGPGPTSPPPQNEPLDAGSLAGSMLVDRVKRNPKPYIAVVGGLLLLRLLRRRR